MRLHKTQPVSLPEICKRASIFICSLNIKPQFLVTGDMNAKVKDCGPCIFISYVFEQPFARAGCSCAKYAYSFIHVYNYHEWPRLECGIERPLRLIHIPISKNVSNSRSFTSDISNTKYSRQFGNPSPLGQG